METGTLIHTPLLRRFQWLADDASRNQIGSTAEAYRYCAYEDLVSDVRNNIERILNSRVPFLWDYLYAKTLVGDTNKAYSEKSLLDHSLWNFGMNDFCYVAKRDGDNERFFKRSIKLTVDRHEPRINVTELTFGNQDRPSSPIIQLKIKGKLWIPPIESKLEFDTAINLGSQKVNVTHHRAVADSD